MAKNTVVQILLPPRIKQNFFSHGVVVGSYLLSLSVCLSLSSLSFAMQTPRPSSRKSKKNAVWIAMEAIAGVDWHFCEDFQDSWCRVQSSLQLAGRLAAAFVMRTCKMRLRQRMSGQTAIKGWSMLHSRQTDTVTPRSPISLSQVAWSGPTFFSMYENARGVGWPLWMYGHFYVWKRDWSTHTTQKQLKYSFFFGNVERDRPSVWIIWT